MTKKKLKVVHLESNHAQTATVEPIPEAEPEHESKSVREPRNGEMLEKALQALRDLNGKATSPALVKKLGFEGENARDKVRRLMDELVVQHKVKETKLEQTDEIGRKGQFIYEAVEAPA